MVREFQDAGRAIVHVETAGFKSSNYVSHSQVVNAIVDQYVARLVPGRTRTQARLVNVFASLPYQDPFWKGNLRELKRILEGIGLQVNILFGPDSGGVEEWRRIPEAAFNLLVSAWPGLEIVQHLEARFGQPFHHFPHFPIGSNETSRFLRGVAAFAGLEQGPVEALHRPGERTFYEEIDSLATFLLEFRYGLPGYVHIIHDASYVLGISKFLLHEVGIVPREQFNRGQHAGSLPGGHPGRPGIHLGQARHPRGLRSRRGRAQGAIRGFRHPGGACSSAAAGTSPWRRSGASTSCRPPSRLPTGWSSPRATSASGVVLRLIEDIYDRVLATYP